MDKIIKIPIQDKNPASATLIGAHYLGSVPVYVPRQALVAEPPVLLAPVDGLLTRLDPRHGQAAVGLQPRQNLHIIPLNEC